jgi:hypothetical protein
MKHEAVVTGASGGQIAILIDDIRNACDANFCVLRKSYPADLKAVKF